MIAAAEPYVQAAMWGFVPGFGSSCCATSSPRSSGRAPRMVVTLVCVGFNAVAGYGLIFGAFGLPALGLRGAGIAAALTNVLMFLGLLGYVLVDRQFRRYQISAASGARTGRACARSSGSACRSA